jgi:hypothetical protein
MDRPTLDPETAAFVAKMQRASDPPLWMARP